MVDLALGQQPKSARLGEEVTPFERDGDETVVRTNKAAEATAPARVWRAASRPPARKDGVDHGTRRSAATITN